MQHYINQLLADIAHSMQHVNRPFAEKEFNYRITEEDEDKTAPIQSLQEWTGIYSEMLPPEEMLNDKQVHSMLEILKKLLDAYNCSFVLQFDVPTRIQYTTIRLNFNQEVKVKQWYMGFFSFCAPGTEHKKCTLGEYCQCAFYKELFSDFEEEDPDPEEERSRALEIEVQHIKRKYGDDWFKYYPYHLDKNYDDEFGPANSGKAHKPEFRLNGLYN